MERTRQKHLYFWMMGTCIVLIVLAWNVVRLWSVPVAIAMSAVAAVIPPVAAIVGNWGAMRDSEPPTFHQDPDR
ncbi:MAG: hypothetical protein ACJ72E_15825 [Marmoricola sp.]